MKLDPLIGTTPSWMGGGDDAEGIVVSTRVRLARNLAGLLASRNAAGTIPDIADHFERMLDAHRGVVRAEVTTAVELGQEHIDRLASTLGEAVGANVVIGTRVDPTVIGGVVARVGDRLVDGSVRTRLQEMKRELSR